MADLHLLSNGMRLDVPIEAHPPQTAMNAQGAREPLAAALALLGVAVALRRRHSRRRRPIDVGPISDRWLMQQRGERTPDS